MRTLSCTFLAVVLLAAPAAAQPGSRFSVSVNGGAQPASPSLSETFTFERNVETARAEIEYPSKTAVLFEGGLGIRLWRQVGAGLAVSYASSDGTADVEASIPHPFFFGRPRATSGGQGGITRSETAAHLQLLYFLPASGKLRAVLSAGPSFISLQQDVVTDVRYSETYPYDTAAFTRADTKQATGSAPGFNVGADISWMLGKSFGVGGLVRFSRASVDLDVVDERRLGVDAGGLQAGAGIRLYF